MILFKNLALYLNEWKVLASVMSYTRIAAWVPRMDSLLILSNSSCPAVS